MAQKSSWLHYKALMQKNWILWKRSCFCSVCEIILPLIFCLLLLAIRQAIDEDVFDKNSFLDEQIIMNSKFTSQSLSNISQTDENYDYKVLQALLQENHIKDCSCHEARCHGGKIALVPEGNYFIGNINSYITQIGLETKYFQTSEELDKYIKDERYGEDQNEKICFGIVMNKMGDGGQYSYEIRYNQTLEEPEDTDIQDTLEDRTESVKKFYIIRNVKINLEQIWICIIRIQKEDLFKYKIDLII